MGINQTPKIMNGEQTTIILVLMVNNSEYIIHTPIGPKVDVYGRERHVAILWSFRTQKAVRINHLIVRDS